MDYARNICLLPDEVFIALKIFLGNSITTNPENCQGKSPGKLYPIHSDSDVSSMQRNTNNFQEEANYGCSTNESPRQKAPSGVQGKLSPCCGKNKDCSDCNSAQCPNNSTFHQEKPAVYPCQDQAFRQQLMQLRRSGQQCSPKFTRSQSVPRPSATDRYTAAGRFDCQRGLHAGQDTINPPRGCCAGRNPCEGERQKCQMPMQQPQRQRQCPSRQPQANDMTFLEDDESSVFEPNLNSTMTDEKKCCQTSTKKCQQQANKTCGSQSPQKMYRISEERRQSQYETPQVPRQAAQRRNTQEYESFVNRTSYLDPPEGLRNAKCKPNKSQCPDYQALYQSPINLRKPCQRNPRCPSLSPLYFSKYQSQGATSYENNTYMKMHNSEMYPEDTKSARKSTYMNISRAMLERSCLNETSLDNTNQNSGWSERSTRKQAKTPEDYLAERTQLEFMDALVKDRACPGAIQSTLNGNENFNELAFDIAFAGPIPNKPFPLDPITMVEAIKLRIDYEREEIRRNHRLMKTEDIESYFDEKIKSEVNEGVAAFLKAESQTGSNGQPDTFEACINSLDTNMFDDSIKLHVYSATTQRGQGEIDLGYH